MPAPTAIPTRQRAGAPRVLGAAALVVGLVACSDDAGTSDTGAPRTDAGTSRAPAPPPATTVVPIGAGGVSTRTTTPATTGGSLTSAAPSAKPIPAGAAQVTIADFAFRPEALTVAPGQPVVFTNADSASHSVASATSELLQSDTLAPGAQFTVTFDTAATYDYFCGIHSHMSGTIEVSP